jgi:hypothetical protein
MGMRGRWYRWDKRETTEERLNFDIVPFAKSVDLRRRCFGSWQWTWTSGRESSISYAVQPGEGVQLSYTMNKQREYNYVVATTTTPQPLGGVRWWWLCPNCGQRVRILYRTSSLFVCRCWAGVYYETQQNKSLMVRTDNQLLRIRRKLKAKGGSVADSWPPRSRRGCTGRPTAGWHSDGERFRWCAFMRLEQRSPAWAIWLAGVTSIWRTT